MHVVGQVRKQRLTDDLEQSDGAGLPTDHEIRNQSNNQFLRSLFVAAAFSSPALMGGKGVSPLKKDSIRLGSLADASPLCLLSLYLDLTDANHTIRQ